METNRIITISEEKGLKVSLISLGASIFTIEFDGQIMTLTPSTIDEFTLPRIYYGKMIGPIANRIKDGLLEINGKKYTYDINEGRNTLHSGKNGISNKEFNYKLSKNKKEVIFYLEEKEVRYEFIYQVDGSTLNLSIKAMAKEDIPLALTNHAYFCLGDDGLDDLSLYIPANEFVETESTTLLPLREKDLIPCLDFNETKRIMQDINNPYLMNHRSLGYDHCFLLNKGKLRLENSHYILNIITDFKAVQIYSDNYPDAIKMMTSNKENHRGIAIEPQDSLLDRQLIKKGSVYSRTIQYHFSKK